MEQIKIYEFYSFGYNYNILLNGNSNKTNEEFYKDVIVYVEFINKLDLRVTISSIKLVNLQPEFDKLAKLGKAIKTKKQTVEVGFRKIIVDKLMKVDSTLDAELNIKIGYLLDEKRFTKEILLDNINLLFSINSFFLLPSIAQFDFEESGKCLAFDRYTACAFHALRGTEDVVKMYYEKLFSKTANDRDTWGTYENAITTAITSGTLLPQPDEQLILNITNIRKYYRNKTQHPQNTYSSDEAQDLLSLCTKTVNEIIQDLKQRLLV